MAAEAPLTDDALDFSLIIASAVHDMKNSLGMLLHTLEQLREEIPSDSEGAQRLVTLHYEAERVHGDLLQLLGLYRLNESSLALSVDEHRLEDVLGEVAARFEGLTNARDIRLSIDCPPGLVGYFDRELVIGILGNVINNAIRYTRQAIELSASEHGGTVTINVADDGNGYPRAMLGPNPVTAGSLSFDTGSSKLGLYFARRIAELHRQGDQRGGIELANGGPLGGGIFRLRLP